MKHISTLESFLNEAYDGNLKDFQYEFPLHFENETGNNPNAIKKIAKAGKGYEVRTSTYMSEPEMKKVGDAMNLKLVSYEKSSNVAITVYESEKTLNEGVVSIKGGRILAHKVLNKLVDMEIIPVKKKTEDLVEAIASLLATTSMSESLNEAFEVIYTNQHVRGSKKFRDRSKAMSFAKELIAQGANEVDVFNAGGNFNSSADTGAVIAWYGNGTYMDNMSKKDPKLAAKKIDKSELSEGMVQVAGKNKPSGAKVLATIIVDDLMKKEYLKPGADKVKSYLVDDVQDVIMNNTF
jgi:hypothetical protein